MGQLATIGANGVDPFAAAAQRDRGAAFGQFMKFSGNDGTYTFGKDQEELEHGTQLVVNPMELAAGWICWKDGKLVDEDNVRVVDGNPRDEEDLKDHGPYDNDDDNQDGWQEQRIIHLASIDGELFILKLSSKGGIRAFGKLLEDFSLGRKKHGFDMVPVIELDANGFDAKNKKGKKIGKKFAPKFTIIKWMSEDELIAATSAGEDEDDYADDETEVKALPAPKKAEKPARQAKRAPAVEEEDEDEDEKTTRPTRQRRAAPEPEVDEDEDDAIPTNDDDEDEDEAPPAPRGRQRRKF